ncbi:MAG: hypothetical protein CL528_13325 [Aequorivita sp.]|nr:hypothetical protein [Aequorivita sp.]
MEKEKGVKEMNRIEKQKILFKMIKEKINKNKDVIVFFEKPSQREIFALNILSQIEGIKKGSIIYDPTEFSKKLKEVTKK